MPMVTIGKAVWNSWRGYDGALPFLILRLNDWVFQYSRMCLSAGAKKAENLRYFGAVWSFADV